MNKGLTIGVDKGGTRTKYGLADTVTGQVVYKFVLPTEKNTAEKFQQQVAFVIQHYRSMAMQQAKDIEGIGFVKPGFATWTPSVGLC